MVCKDISLLILGSVPGVFSKDQSNELISLVTDPRIGRHTSERQFSGPVLSLRARIIPVRPFKESRPECIIPF